MEFNVSTFILEILNFLVLVWILQRLFYKPLLEIIAKRKQHIEQTLANAQRMQQQAEEQCTLYENRQRIWEQEKQNALATLHQEIDIERDVQLEKLQHELEQERQKHQVNINRQQHEFQQHAQQQALRNAAKFASIFLSQTATPELETKFANLLIEQLNASPESLNVCLLFLKNQSNVSIKITSVFILDLELKQQLEQCFATLISIPLLFEYQQDATLIAGLRVDIGAWVLETNLKHELSGFAELAYDSK